MKKSIIYVLMALPLLASQAQDPSSTERLYLTCKVWGFVKYTHSAVSNCKVNWDSTLVSVLPLVKQASTRDDFNNVLLGMLRAAGPMEIATTPPPDTVDAELRENIDFAWSRDPYLRQDVQAALDTIRTNYRPHATCWVNQDGTSGYGWLAFPYDDPIMNTRLLDGMPDEFQRTAAVFRYWNLMNYFNPNRYILTTSWDSTLSNIIPQIEYATTRIQFLRMIRMMTARLDDAHVEGMTSTLWPAYVPRIVLRYAQGEYVVVKSAYPELAVGDCILSIDGKNTAAWEDSLRPVVSAGNPAVFRRFMCDYMRRGYLGTPIVIEYKDSTGSRRTLSTYRYSLYSGSWFGGYYPQSALDTVKWYRWPCNVGYVHMGNLSPSDVWAMTFELQDTKAIIFDVRNYPNGTAPAIVNALSSDSVVYAHCLLPSVVYPGTYTRGTYYVGTRNNPTPYPGKIIILCNQETQSHAEWSCMMLRTLPNALVVGSQTAGADGNVAGFLISQDMSTGFTALGVYNPDWSNTQRIGIVPDSIVYLSAEGIRQKRDEVLEVALRLAGCDLSSSDAAAYHPQPDISIYPNPVKDILVVTHAGPRETETCYEIRNALGASVALHSDTNHGGTGGPVSLKTAGLPAGMYYLTVSNRAGTRVKPFIIVR